MIDMVGEGKFHMVCETIRRTQWVLGCCVAFVAMAVAVACIITGTDEKYNGRNGNCQGFHTKNVKQKSEGVTRATSRRVQVQYNAVRTIDGKGDDSSAYAPAEDFQRLSEKAPVEMPEADRAQMASDKNQVMDELLNRSAIPEDYGAQMIALFRDMEQDVLTRDFAVQHMGLYAQALRRRGLYNPELMEAASLREALFEAVSETRTIVAAAAFRAISDIAEFDPNIDMRLLGSRLVACISDPDAATAVRVVAAQLCGERRIVSAVHALAVVAKDPSTPETLRRSALYALRICQSRASFDDGRKKRRVE